MTHSSRRNDAIPLRSRVISGSITIITMRWLVRLMGLLSTLVLARLLTPEDFGIVAIATALMAFIAGVTEMNTSAALIKFQDPTHDDFGSAWTLNIIRGMILSAALAAAAVPIGVFMKEERLTMVIFIIALKPLILSIENPYFVEFEKRVDFKQLFRLELFTKFMGMSVTIVLAIIFRNYWALVLGGFVSATARVALSFLLRPAAPTINFRSVRSIFSFTAWLMGRNLFIQFNTQIYILAIGRAIGLVDSGKFHLANHLSGLAAEFLGPLSRAIYPAFAELDSSSSRLRSAYVNAVALLMAIAVPAGVGLALISQDFVRVLLGEQWTEIWPFFAALSAMMAIASLVAVGDAFLVAAGHPNFTFYREVALTLFTLVAVGVAAVDATLASFFVARVASGVFWTLATQFLVLRVLGWRTGLLQISQGWRTLLAALVMAVVIVGLQHLIPVDSAFDASLLRLVLCLSCGFGAYVTAHSLLWLISGKPHGPESHLIATLGDYWSRVKIRLHPIAQLYRRVLCRRR